MKLVTERKVESVEIHWVPDKTTCFEVTFEDGETEDFESEAFGEDLTQFLMEVGYEHEYQP